MEELAGIIAIVSIFIVLPWMFLHYSAKKRETASSQAGDPMLKTRLQAIADRLEKRVQALETILDAEVPGWRKHLDHGTERRDL